MSRVDVRGSGYTDAAEYLADANQLTLMTYRDLAAALAGTGAMAGTDVVAAELGAAYDDAARATLDATADLVGGLAGLGLAIRACFGNHSRAEQASHLRNPFGPITTSDPDYTTGTFYDAAPSVVPASLGGDPASLPGWATWILDRVGGFVGPDADTPRLRDTAAAWRAAAADLLTDISGVDRAILRRGTELSPEVPLAVAELFHADQATTALSAQMSGLADICQTYADQVDAQRAAILDIVSDLIRDTAILEAAGLVVDVFTGIGGTAGATELVAAKIAARAPDILRLVELVRDLLRGFTASLQVIATAVKDLGFDLKRLWRLRMAARDERGAIQIARSTSWLEAHEIDGSHTLAKHVGKSMAFLRRRLRQDPDLRSVSTFNDIASAERGIGTAIERDAVGLKAYLDGSKRGYHIIETTLRSPLGPVLRRTGEILDGHTVRVVVTRDPRMPDGFRIISSYVKP